MAKLGIIKVKLDREVNCYVVSCADTKEAVVIDPGGEHERILEIAGAPRAADADATKIVSPLMVHKASTVTSIQDGAPS